MFFTVIGRNITYIKEFCDHGTAGSWKQSCISTYTYFFYSRRHFKIFVIKSLMDSCHDLAPHIFVEVTGIIIRELFVVVKSGPYCTGVIWSVAYKPQVIVIICGTCLSCYCHIVQLAGSSRTVLYNVLHGACEKPCSALLNYRTFSRSFFDQNIAAVIKDLCVVKRFNVITLVGYGSIGCAKLHVCYTVSQTAKCKRKIGVCPYSSVGICVCLCPMGKSCEAKVVQILKTKLRSNLLQTFHCDYVYRVLDSFSDRGCSSVSSGSVFYRRTIRVVIWFVLKCCGQCHALFVESRSIGRNNFECGTGLSGGICRTVQSKTGGFFAASADNCFYIAGMLVNHAHGRLRLRRKVYALRNNLASVCKN